MADDLMVDPNILAFLWKGIFNRSNISARIRTSVTELKTRAVFFSDFELSRKMEETLQEFDDQCSAGAKILNAIEEARDEHTLVPLMSQFAQYQEETLKTFEMLLFMLECFHKIAEDPNSQYKKEK